MNGFLGRRAGPIGDGPSYHLALHARERLTLVRFAKNGNCTDWFADDPFGKT
jgi:hypothetical protein